MTKKYIFSAILLGCAAAFTACEDDLDPNSIFEEVSDELDPNSASYQLDKFLEDNYRAVYNLQFRYKMQDVGTDMNYNLIPATYANSVPSGITLICVPFLKACPQNHRSSCVGTSLINWFEFNTFL